MQNIAISDLVYYLICVLQEPRAYKQAYNVGSDDVLTNDEMMDVAADLLGKAHPRKMHLPQAIPRMMAPMMERGAKLSKGYIKTILDCAGVPMTGDCLPIRAILPKPILSYREAVQEALRA